MCLMHIIENLLETYLANFLQSSLPVRPATKAEQMRECLRALKQNHKVNTTLLHDLDYRSLLYKFFTAGN